MLRSAVERQLEIIGEALSRLAKAAPDLAERIPGARSAIGMRNVLIHGYARVDNETVWRTATEAVPVLRTEVAELLLELGDTP